MPKLQDVCYAKKLPHYHKVYVSFQRELLMKVLYNSISCQKLESYLLRWCCDQYYYNNYNNHNNQINNQQ